MREYTDTTKAGIVKADVLENFLLTLHFSTTLHFSSRGDTDWDSNTYHGREMKGRIALDQSRASLQILDKDYQLLPWFTDEGTHEIMLTVRVGYGEKPYAETDQVFKGRLGSWRMEGPVLYIEGAAPEVLHFPNITITAANGFNHIPRKGPRIKPGRALSRLIE